jgi:hypothetical protein
MVGKCKKTKDHRTIWHESAISSHFGAIGSTSAKN